jgi:hypothetical protein
MWYLGQNRACHGLKFLVLEVAKSHMHRSDTPNVIH